MANSSYYYDAYKREKRKVKDYQENLSELKDIRYNLRNTLTDEIRSVNTEIDDLRSDLKESVRHNSKFTSHVGDIYDEREKYVSSDSYLSTAIGELDDEITRINNLKDEAESDRDYYYRKYEQKKEEEYQAWLRTLYNA